MQEVKAWEEEVVIPTYPTGEPEKNPMFLEKRVYQGSSGVVYPHAVIEKIADEKTDKIYRAVYLENEYLKIMILPELGGRIQMAWDKVKQRHFVYYNQVIKPALVGLTGPWISGGIEFNWPQHHRPSTFSPIDYCIKTNEDGSKTVWVNEVERMFRTKGMAGFTLYPGKAYLEISGKLYNRTPFPQTFLWWANPAVKVNDHYQSVFPPDVHAVFDHGKRDVSAFPIAKGVYYKVDYAPGTDISRYKNIPVPTSYMAASSKYNFIGGYEHDSGGGLLHVADRHVSPGKKQWTWGHGAFGQAWDRNLTDEDGPYIELMTGVFTDNQPDFSWLQPYEEKTFTQYFMPYREVGVVKNASKDVVANVEVDKGQCRMIVYTTSVFQALEISLLKAGQLLYSEVTPVSPEKPYTREITVPENLEASEVLFTIRDAETGRELLRYQAEKEKDQPVPQPAKPALLPEKVESCEQLYLTGMHLEQYRHATYVATDYYQEALRRDAGDIRNNNAMGLWLLRRGKFSEAEGYFRSAVKTMTERNPNPYDGEPLYNLGWSLAMQEQYEEAYELFYKATWNDAWKHAGFLNLARIASLRGWWEDALAHADKALVKNYHSHTARHAKVFILRKLGRTTEALALIADSLTIDPFHFGCLFERYLLYKAAGQEQAAAACAALQTISRNEVHNYIEYALDYAHAGLYEEAFELLYLQVQQSATPYPLAWYYLGWFAFKTGKTEEALHCFRSGAALGVDFVFPNRMEEVLVLQAAIACQPDDAHAHYFLGNYWYDKRQYTDAVAHWEKAVALKQELPTAHRNLALAYYNKQQNPQKALASLETAFALDKTDARVLMELDQLYKKMGKPLAGRLLLLEQYADLVSSRDDLFLEKITLYNQLEDYVTARNLIAAGRFHPWEGGEGKVVAQYLICHIELAKVAIAAGKAAQALHLLEQAEVYPDNLGEGKLTGVQENDIHFWKGVAYELLGNAAQADHWFRLSTQGIKEPVQAIFYNDPQPDKILYQGWSWKKLGEPDKAAEVFQRLIDFGQLHQEDIITIDYFAVSLPDMQVFDMDLSERNRIHCLYLQALGWLGKGDTDKADALFTQILQADVNHQGAIVHKNKITMPMATVAGIAG
ncbi:Tfp pilus assembly protein PilF [Filimonas lacunae]|uniref:Tfp pilus assembly protein PilF n=2 Tax=Filimonas lacunae TaxID=477680 RepID=A0A1N7QYB0_9BACT|nr:Tfp pilus assembly protein PilF [Filimonas lacunae]